ncbi:MAG: hypothetical protein KGI37_06500 [Alphaproteobacteria bacterium]|nr:hypothetical protein [Alphaproteobacteria bacterium]
MTPTSEKPAEEGKSCKTSACGIHSCSPCIVTKLAMILLVLGLIASHFFK